MLKVRSEIDVDVVALELYELEVTPPREDFELEVKRATQAARSGQVGSIGRARELYRRFGTDPTRVRPSSEALLRRVKKGEPLPRINSLVDVANALSVQLQVPVGLYDLGKVAGGELVTVIGMVNWVAPSVAFATSWFVAEGFTAMLLIRQRQHVERLVRDLRVGARQRRRHQAPGKQEEHRGPRTGRSTDPHLGTPSVPANRSVCGICFR